MNLWGFGQSMLLFRVAETMGACASCTSFMSTMGGPSFKAPPRTQRVFEEFLKDFWGLLDHSEKDHEHG